jgi:murein L,D-transpeptidase YafK
MRFWQELKAGFDYFENTKKVPTVKIVKGTA